MNKLHRLGILGRFMGVLAVMLCCTGHAGAQTTLVAKGSAWKYLDDGSNQGAAWRASAFDDSSWASGAAPLGYSGTPGAYGSFPLGTTVSYGGISTAKYITTYIRKAFNIADPADFAGFTVNVLRDDGVVLYINGTEAARLGMPAGAILYNTLATPTVNTATAYDTVSLSPALFVAGTNSLAVEVHQAAITSSDIVLDLELIGGPLAVSRGPYLQMNSDSAITIRWRTNAASDSRVWLGATSTSLTPAMSDATTTTEHELRITGLQPDTQYFYAVGSSGGQLEGADADHYFFTSPTPGTDKPTRLWVLGDCGTANANQTAVRDAYYNSPSYQYNNLVLLLGDNAYDVGSDSEYQSAIFDMYPAVLRQSPVWSCLGNHETAQATGGSYNIAYFDLFTFPTLHECGGYTSNTERYFSWNFGNVHFISLDSQTTNTTLRNSMLAWLQNDLAAVTARWTIALWHHPPYTHGSHNSDSEAQLVWMRENILPVLESNGVDLVLSGHSHAYERSYLLDGAYGKNYTSETIAPHKVSSSSGREGGDGAYGKDYGANEGAVYAVAGSSGKISGGSLDHPAMYISLNQLGSLAIDITGNRLDAKFITSTGSVADYFTLLKGPAVSVAVPTPDAAEYGPVAGQFTLTRSGSTAGALDVQFTLGGAAAASRYKSVSIPVTIPVGESSAAVAITPVPDSNLQGAQSVTLSLDNDFAYRLGAINTGMVTIYDTLAGAPPVASWYLAKFGAEANNPFFTDDNADPDGDSIVNLLEYALDTDPLVFSSDGLPEVGLSGDYLTLTTAKNSAATDIMFTVQSTGDLTNGASWSSLSGANIIQNTLTLLEVRDNIPLSNSTPRFMRLKVTRP